MAKLVQICASRNDLFSLDDKGGVYQYNFNTAIWTRLGRGRGAAAGTQESKDARGAARASFVAMKR